jgi:hypothetical protein
MSKGSSGECNLVWSVHMGADGRRGWISIRTPPNHVADGFKGTASQARYRLGALVCVSAVAALSGNGRCGIPGGRHGGELVVSYVFCE